MQLISQRVGRCLERQGLLEQDAENAWLDLYPAEDTGAMYLLLGCAITYQIAIGPQQVQKAFTIRTINCALVRVQQRCCTQSYCDTETLCS